MQANHFHAYYYKYYIPSNTLTVSNHKFTYHVAHVVAKEQDPAESPMSRIVLDSPMMGSLITEHHDFAGRVRWEHLAGRCKGGSE